jgi:hypothetical protein
VARRSSQPADVVRLICATLAPKNVQLSVDRGFTYSAAWILISFKRGLPSPGTHLAHRPGPGIVNLEIARFGMTDAASAYRHTCYLPFREIVLDSGRKISAAPLCTALLSQKRRSPPEAVAVAGSRPWEYFICKQDRDGLIAHEHYSRKCPYKAILPS